MNRTVLIADDDSALRRLLSDILETEGYDVILACDGQEAMDQFFAQPDISLCILDVMMPKYNGYEVLDTLREHSDVPVIMLTALGDEGDELKGFHKGASDYIAKPFSFPILLARIARLFQEKKSIYEKEGLKVDLDGHVVWVNGEEIQLTPKEFSILTLFITNEGQVLSRDQVLDKAWSYDYDGESRTVDTHVKMLRKKLGECGEYIATARGIGYKFMVKS